MRAAQATECAGSDTSGKQGTTKTPRCLPSSPIAASEEEKKILARDLRTTKAKLQQYETGGEAIVELPPGTKGKIMVVDPKWNFVVLDIGQQQGLLPNGVLMVSRDAKLVGKVKIVSVEPHRSIANIMPGWKLGEIMEGDQVLY